MDLNTFSRQAQTTLGAEKARFIDSFGPVHRAKRIAVYTVMGLANFIAIGCVVLNLANTNSPGSAILLAACVLVGAVIIDAYIWSGMKSDTGSFAAVILHERGLLTRANAEFKIFPAEEITEIHEVDGSTVRRYEHDYGQKSDEASLVMRGRRYLFIEFDRANDHHAYALVFFNGKMLDAILAACEDWLKSVPRSTPLRVWTDRVGHQVEARFVRVENRKIVLQKADGSQISIAVDAFIPEDIAWLRERIS